MKSKKTQHTNEMFVNKEMTFRDCNEVMRKTSIASDICWSTGAIYKWLR